MFFALFKEDVQEKDIVPCYFLYGEETYLAYEFLSQVQELLVPPDATEFRLERFRFEETSWLDVIDLARTAPFMFAPWRIIALEVPPAKDKERAREDKGPFTSREEALVRDYLASPAPKTVLVIIAPGKPDFKRRLVKFFTSFPPSVVRAVEVKPLKATGLLTWLDGKLRGLGKAMDAEAKSRLVAVAGNSLSLLASEIEKLVTYVAERKVIEVEDVNQVSDWTRSAEHWELGSALEQAELEPCLRVLQTLFRSGSPPELVLNTVAGFFREILAAQAWLREGRDKQEIFKILRPRISERWADLYTKTFRALYATVEGLRPQDLNACLQELSRIDNRLKTSDSSPQAELEAFIVEYCRLRREGKAIWSERR